MKVTIAFPSQAEVIDEEVRRFRALSPEDRLSASMFYLGYEASQVHARTVNVAMIPSIVGLAVDYCAAEPTWTVAQAFSKAYWDTRGW